VEKPEGLLATALLKAASGPLATFLLTLVGLLEVDLMPRLESPVGKALWLAFFTGFLPLPPLLELLGVALAGTAAAPAACLSSATLHESDLCKHTCKVTGYSSQ